MANPKAEYDSEWVEIYNGSTTSIDLDGWKVDDGEGGGSPLHLPAGSIAESGGYLVVDLPNSLLNNDGDSIRLIRPDGVVADTTSYASSAADTSHCRALDGSWYESEQPTPGAPNIPPSAPTATAEPPTPSAAQSPSSGVPSSISTNIRLSEVLALPKDAYDAEWVEIANDSDAPADLSGWKLDDGEGGGSPYTLPAGSTIGPQGLLTVIMPRALFNNAGDSARLLGPDGAVIDVFDYSPWLPPTSASACERASECRSVRRRQVRRTRLPQMWPGRVEDDTSAQAPAGISVTSRISPASSAPSRAGHSWHRRCIIVASPDGATRRWFEPVYVCARFAWLGLSWRDRAHTDSPA